MTDIATTTQTETVAATDAVASVPEATTTPTAPSKPARDARKTTAKATAKAGAAADASPAPPMAPGVEMIPLADLDLSPLNPRAEAAVDEAAIARLADNIRAAGLIHDLAGLRGEDGRVGIVAGGRRLRALRLLHEAEPGSRRSATVPVRLAPDEEIAWLWAEAMPAAQWIGWHEIEGRGLTPTYPEAGGAHACGVGGVREPDRGRRGGRAGRGRPRPARRP